MRWSIPLIAFSLLNCGAPTPERPFSPEPYDALFAMTQREALIAIDGLHPADNPASAVWWLVFLRDADVEVELRTRAAMALAECGFAEGERFLLAVLGANLGEEFRESDRRHALPQYDRWAFPREIALAWCRSRLLDATREIPSYDVNFGAPQMLEAARAYARALASVTPLRPKIDAARLARTTPESSSVAKLDDAWQAARSELLAWCRAAAPGTR